MYKICSWNLGQSVHNKNIGSRPVVVVYENKDIMICYKITTRNKFNPSYVRMNYYQVSGFCCCSIKYHVNKKDISNFRFMRYCTTSEITGINKAISFVKRNNCLQNVYNISE